MSANPFWLIIAAIGIIFAGVTVILGTKLRQKRILKYLPAFLTAFVSAALAIKAFWFSEGFEGLGYVILLMITVVIFLISIITALVLEIINRRKKS